MHKSCPYCGLDYEPEPGFYWGAMYISYAFSVGVVLITGFVLYFFFNDPELWVYLVSIPLALLAFMPFMFRYSRVLLLYFLARVKYDPSFAESGVRKAS